MEKEILTTYEKKRRWRPKPRTGTPSLNPPFTETPTPLKSKWWVLMTCVRILVALTEGGRMVRLVGPNHRPLERYQFEDPTRRDLRQFGGGAY